MIQELQLTLTPKESGEPELLKHIISQKLRISSDQITTIQHLRKSIDARGRSPKVLLTTRVYVNESPRAVYTETFNYQNVSTQKEVLIVGAGPAGLFAALRFIELGLKPIILERGENVADRKRTLALLHRNLALNEESNYCFGEGGAGTFSDGKLYTRSKKRGNPQRIFEIFHYHGAQDEILYETHPHIGSDRLPVVIKNIRETIISSGGEIHFNTKVTELLLEGSVIKGVVLQSGETLRADSVILATGHSARDIYELLDKHQILLESKGCAIGLRIEHPQTLIDSIQYKCKDRGPYLPAATYSLVQQVNDRGVYSFCMCPGGHIVPSATALETVVVNGMSASHRNSPFANSALVVELRPEDIGSDRDPLAGLRYQEMLEALAYQRNGGGLQSAPAQRVSDFIAGKFSTTLPDCTYLPGINSSPIHEWLPGHISSRLRGGILQFDKRMRGFNTNEATLVGVETRSSSPIRIPRHLETFEHPQIKGLYACGEGSGYAGGITSSAIDGENCAERCAMNQY